MSGQKRDSFVKDDNPAAVELGAINANKHQTGRQTHKGTIRVKLKEVLDSPKKRGRRQKREVGTVQNLRRKSKDKSRHDLRYLVSDKYSKETKEAVRLLDKNPKLSFTHIGSGKYECSYCRAVIGEFSDTPDHRLQHAYTVMSCDVCDRKFASKAGYECHMAQHMKPAHNCKDCSFTTHSDFLLKIHRRNQHSALIDMKDHFQSPYVSCKLCGQQFGSKGDLHVHVETKHGITNSEVRTYVCEKCGKLYLSASSFKGHKLTHRGKQFHCPVEGCNISFISKPILKTHVKTVHSEERKFSCEIDGCQKKFKVQKYLQEHVKAVHLKLRNVFCDWPGCGKSFTARKHLRVHKRIHEDVHHLKCDQCDYTCRQRTALNWHLKKHNDPVSSERGESNKRKDKDGELKAKKQSRKKSPVPSQVVTNWENLHRYSNTSAVTSHAESAAGSSEVSSLAETMVPTESTRESLVSETKIEVVSESVRCGKSQDNTVDLLANHCSTSELQRTDNNTELVIENNQWNQCVSQPVFPTAESNHGVV